MARDIADMKAAMAAAGVSDGFLNAVAPASCARFGNGHYADDEEVKVWRDVKLPAGKVILPGVVSHSTNVIEHPELVADRVVRYAESVGRENVVASTDCGLGGRVHPQIAWAKLGTLVEGAELASRRLWS